MWHWDKNNVGVGAYDDPEVSLSYMFMWGVEGAAPYSVKLDLVKNRVLFLFMGLENFGKFRYNGPRRDVYESERHQPP